jgi:D-3-phosphoglycerate dehydrogenase / 2-oxoglutarate reductase
MSTRRVLITDKVHPLIIDGINALGYEIDYDTSIDMDTLGDIIHLYEGMIINSKIKMHQPMIDKGIQLKFIGRLGSGMEIIDQAYARSKGIIPINSPEGNRNAVAEHAVGMILALYNNMIRANHEVKNFMWNREQNRGLEIKGKTIGIIGLGHTGEQFARKLATWECTILAYDKYRVDYPSDLSFIQHTSIEEIRNRSDIISFHLPLTDETKYMCNTDFLNRCKQKPLIVNTSRGNVVETNALINALQSKSIFGACLDVFENEKVASFSKQERAMYEQLYGFDNVIVSPHIAGWTQESLVGIASVLLEKIKQAVSKI